MAIYRHTHADCFTVLPNALIRDSALTLRDVGLLAYLLSLPEDWQFSVRGMDAILENDGKNVIQTSLRNLENQGYLRRFQPRGENGLMMDNIWDITDIPRVFGFLPLTEGSHTDKPCTEKPCTDEPCTEKPCTVEPCTVNPPQTKKLSNKETINKETIKQTQFRKEYQSQKHGETDLPYIWKSGYEM